MAHVDSQLSYGPICNTKIKSERLSNQRAYTL